MPTRTDFSKLCPIFAGTSLEMGSQKELTLSGLYISASITTKQLPYVFRRPVDVLGAVAFRQIPDTGIITPAESNSSRIGIYTDSTDAGAGTIFGSISVTRSLDFTNTYVSADLISTKFTTGAKMFFKMIEKGTVNMSLGKMTVVVRYRDA